ncbi:hypothetical protein [Nonomuraea pusilla]|uniref:5-methylcytosine-specific restriction enzyme A n=1 Tax=Nonomuraea pusilla TaxID=46177 RepID=A0A1H8K8D9_9ACTN|nr:hypothetical protein [Nonomuraea pusilla]SEN88977.1 5-methylcytosine-specific restriction enzyme A [Nonomuraea pusilla]
MKRGNPLARRTPLKQGKPPERKTPLKSASNLERRAPLKPRSKKQEAKYRVRRVLVAELLAERPVCERCHAARSTDVHEPRMRSRGADINDPDQCVCLCRDCHRWVHDHPAAATAEGWLIPSWEAAS